LWAPTAPNFIHNGSKIVQNKDKHSFTPWCEVERSLHRFSLNSQLFNSFQWRSRI
jgi:hypothetical protein